MAVQPAHQDDVQEWIGRLNAVLAKPEIITAPAPASARPWHTGFFECFMPIDLCLITCCCPCVTFGKTHHRLRKDPTMAGYSPINASCLGFWVSTWFGVHCIPLLMQRSDIRTKYGLTGEFVPDCLKSWCCGCCELIQQEKEAEYQLLHGEEVVMTQPERKDEAMTYGANEPAKVAV